MKRTCICMFLITVTATMLANASDLRTINKAKVDLQPIHDWKAAKAERGSKTNSASLGERPMKHWKDITVTECVKNFTAPVVMMATADGGSQTVMLRNCPPRLVAKLNRKNTLLAQLGRASAASKYAAADAAEKEGRASSSYTVSGSAAYVDAVVAEEQRRQDQAAAAAAKEKLTKATEQAIEGELQKLEAEIAIEGKLLAMFTGATYDGFPVWDTGLASR